jgi:ankyrin repeat domain-containing protein 17
MAAFRKGHVKVVKWMVKRVTQFPSDQEMTRFISTVVDKDLLKKCHHCMEIIRAAKDHQAAEANKNAANLLDELDMEKIREDLKRAAAARKREKKKRKKQEKKEEKRRMESENDSTIDQENDTREQVGDGTQHSYFMIIYSDCSIQ